MISAPSRAINVPTGTQDTLNAFGSIVADYLLDVKQKNWLQIVPLHPSPPKKQYSMADDVA